MIVQSNYLTDFLSETNLVLIQEDFGNQLYDLLAPIRNTLNKDKEILSFSLAKYCGAETNLAFYCQWTSFTVNLIHHQEVLEEENKNYFKRKIPVRLRGVPGLYDILKDDVKNNIIPQQLSIIQAKQKQLLVDILIASPELQKYLQPNVWNQIQAAIHSSKKFLYQEEKTTSAYIESLGWRESFVQIGLPCLLGFVYSFSKEENPINPKGIKWTLLEDIMHGISILHQSAIDLDFRTFIYISRLSDKEEFEWWQIGKEQQIKIVTNSVASAEIVQGIREKIKNKVLQDLESLIFPEKQKEMLTDLIDWAFSIKIQ
jgi:hypothetical protein